MKICSVIHFDLMNISIVDLNVRSIPLHYTEFIHTHNCLDKLSREHGITTLSDTDNNNLYLYTLLQ